LLPPNCRLANPICVTRSRAAESTHKSARRPSDQARYERVPMSFVASIRQRLAEPERRRTIRMVRPGVQLKLAVYLLAVSFGFALLISFNSWAAYGRLFHGTLATAPAPFSRHKKKQTTP
jgi:hypothetical protein